MCDFEKNDDIFDYKKHEEMTKKQAIIIRAIIIRAIIIRAIVVACFSVGLVNYFNGY